MFLRTLGGLALEDAGFNRPKPLLLLAYLALEGAQARRHVAELFWRGGRDHMKSLTVALTRLRQGAPGVVASDGKQVWTEVATDAEQLLACLDKGDIDAALELYRGPFLAGFYLPNVGGELEEWVYAMREYLAGRVQHALLELAEREAARARFEAAAQCAARAYRLAGAPAPEPEELVRLYLFLRAGESPEAAAVEKEARALDLDLSATPENARERLQDSGVRPHPHNLATQPNSFVGRDLELAEAVTLLLEPHRHLLTLLGPAGVGKTRLALQLAQEQLAASAFPGGVFAVPLAPLSTLDHLPAALAAALGLEPQRAESSLEAVLAEIGDSETLLLLDSFEHLAGDAAVLASMLSVCPKLKLLVTSQERLNLAEEHIFPLEGLPFPADAGLSLEEAQHFDAVRLFVRRARRARPDFRLQADNVADVLNICRLVEGLPLGLELAAAWVRVLTCRDIAQELSQNLDLLQSASRNAPEQHRSLRSAFEHSWTRLSAKEQEVLRRLAVFRGGFSREAASAVAGATITVLASLVDKSLLRVDGAGRYTRHRLLYSFSREKLAEQPELQLDAAKEHAAYALKLAEMTRPKLLLPDGESERQALATLTTEYENLRAAMRWSLQHDQPLALRLAGALRTFWEIRGYASEACDWLGAALAGTGARAPAKDRFAAHTAYGRFLYLRGHKDQAQAQFAAALELARHQQHPRNLAEALNHLGLLALEQGDDRRAEGLCEEALAVHRAQGNKRGQAVTLNNLGNIARSQGEHAKAAARYEESLLLHRELGIRRSEAITLGNLGFVARQQHEPARAARLFAESIGIRQALGDKPGLAHSFLGLAGLSCELQDYERSALLLGATDGLLEAAAVQLALADQQDYQRTQALTRDRLGEAGFGACQARGRSLPLDQVTRNALSLTEAIAADAEPG